MTVFESSAGAWYINPIAGGAPTSAAETNARLASAVSESAEAFSTFASPWSIRFRAPDDDADDHAAGPDTNRPSAQLLEDALDRLRRGSEVVDSVDVEFDTNAFIRTPASRVPVRAWVRLGQGGLRSLCRDDARDPLAGTAGDRARRSDSCAAARS